MTTPLNIHADYDTDAYEITYRSLPEGTFVDLDEPVARNVTAGIDPNGQIIGLELLGLERATVAAARAYATAHDLAFPTTIGDVPVGN